MYEGNIGGRSGVVKTEIDNLKLSRCQEALPDCSKFLWDYFSNVETNYNWVTVFRGYIQDLELELLERPELSRFENDLIDVFFDVTKDVDETDECEYVPLRIGFAEEDEELEDEGFLEVEFGFYFFDSEL